MLNVSFETAQAIQPTFIDNWNPVPIGNGRLCALTGGKDVVHGGSKYHLRDYPQESGLSLMFFFNTP